jgi:tRNA G18 (ribose-2'-O)-methylase SpoU
MRGFFEVGIFRGKNEINAGTLWRSAYQLGAAGIFTVGRRYPKQASNTLKTERHIPMREYDDFDAFYAALPYDCQLVGVEMGGEDIKDFKHPARCVYLLGAEDDGLPSKVVARCHRTIQLPCVRTPSFNVAVAGSIVMYDRVVKEQK